MNDQLKADVLAAQQALNDAIAQARAAGITVNLWIEGTGPTATGPSKVGLDFGGTNGTH